MRSTLRKLIMPFVVAGGLLFPNFSNAQVIPGEMRITKVDASVQPDTTTRNWYGSGYVTKNPVTHEPDDEINEADVLAARGLEGVVADSSNRKMLDRADVNGDEKITIEDAQMIKDFVEGVRDYLPGHWNKLKTKEEKLNWFKKMIAIDKTDTLKWVEGKWVSGDFAIQTSINFKGYDGPIPPLYDSRNNRRFNLPLYATEVTEPWHGVTFIQIGENLLEWNGIYLNEPQTDGEVKIGSASLSSNSEVWPFNIRKFSSGGGYYPEFFLRFALLGGIPTLSWYDTANVVLKDISTGISDLQYVPAPKESALEQNYPNPFNGETTIRYQLHRDEEISLEIYNVAGRKLETLVDREFQNAGKHEVRWNASKKATASGIYFSRLRGKGFSETKKMMYVK